MGWGLFIREEAEGKMEKLLKGASTHVYYNVECSCIVVHRGQSYNWHTWVKTSGLKMVNECLCGPWLSTCVLFRVRFHEGGVGCKRALGMVPWTSACPMKVVLGFCLLKALRA
jgi:hypothetical protein